MNGVAIIRALLVAHAPVTDLVAITAVRAGTVPENMIPAIGVREISRLEAPSASLGSAKVMVTARIQATVYAGAYPDLKAILQAAKLGPGPHTGMIAGVKVLSVMRDAVGPDLSNGAAEVYEQARDFKVVYIEQN